MTGADDLNPGPNYIRALLRWCITVLRFNGEPHWRKLADHIEGEL